MSTCLELNQVKFQKKYPKQKANKIIDLGAWVTNKKNQNCLFTYTNSIELVLQHNHKMIFF